MTRTIDEIQQQIDATANFDYFDEYDQDDQCEAGELAGFRHALKMIKDGKTSADILAYTQADVAAYVSHGDDYADAWQSGYTCALYWAAEQYDWDAEGNAIFRPGNIWNEPTRIVNGVNESWPGTVGGPQPRDGEG